MASKKKTKKTKGESQVVNTKGAPKYTGTQWWRAEETDRKPHEILENLFRQIENDQSSRYNAYRYFEELAGCSNGTEGDKTFAKVVSDELTQNEIQSTLETLWAQIYKNRIVPAISVSEADWDEWDQARAASRWLEGAFDDAEVHETVMPKAGWGQMVHGTGLIKVNWEPCEEEDGKKYARITAWPVSARYVFVDRIEAKHGKPRNWWQKDHMDRFVLYDMYSEDDEGYYGTAQERMDAIMSCMSNDDQDLGATSSAKCDMITVKEVWRLPSGPHAKDGKHCIWIKNCTLVYEDWDLTRIPFVRMPFGPVLEGVWGESPVLRLSSMQKKLDRLNEVINRGEEEIGIPRILKRRGINLNNSSIDDVPGIIEADSIGPNDIRDWNATPASPELYQSREELPRKMRGLLGISDFEAQSQLPPNLRDVGAPFLERWIDQGAARHAMDHGTYEKAIVDLAELFLDMAECAEEEGYDVVVKAPSEGHKKTSIESISFKEIKLERKRMKLKVQPMSGLPQTFAGKVEAVEKLNKAGYPMTKEAVTRWTEVPDEHGGTDFVVSSEEIIFKNLTYMCRTGQYVPPMPFDNLDMIILKTTEFINHYRIRTDADTGVIGLLAQYIDEAVALKQGLKGANPNAPPPITTAQALGINGPPPNPGLGQVPGMPPVGAPGVPPIGPAPIPGPGPIPPI